MRRTTRAFGLIGLVTAASLVTAGAASAAPAIGSPSASPTTCTPNMRSGAVPDNWIPRSPAENDRRLTWEQVRSYDRDGDGRLSDAELRNFRNANIQVPNGGPICTRLDNPPRR